MPDNQTFWDSLKAFGKEAFSKAMSITKKKKMKKETNPGAVDDNALKRIKNRNQNTYQMLQQVSTKAKININPQGHTPSALMYIENNVKSAHKKVGLSY